MFYTENLFGTKCHGNFRTRMEFPHTRDILSCIFEKCGKKFFLNKREKMSRLLKVTFCRENIQEIKYP
uniref:Uncharacterized protein n=1 Tax=Strongyloides venezuelensis TaxID=75913 RepID=A0A0K0G5K3_STRVS